MPIKHTVQVDNDLEKAVGEVLNNPRNSFDIQGILTISHDITSKGSFITGVGKIEKDNTTVVELYLNDKYAQFHGEFAQTASLNPELKPLMDYLNKNGWNTNLE